MKKCEFCNTTLGEYKDGKFIVRKESHRDIEIFIDGILQVKCPCGNMNYVKEEK